MEDTIKKIQDSYRTSLAAASLGYLRVGLSIFHQETDLRTSSQVVTGNLGVAIELMLKALIVDHGFTLVFRNLPLELRTLMAGEIKVEHSTSFKPFEIGLRTAQYDTLRLDECISVFYSLFPDKKQLLKPHLKLLAQTRNCSLHSVLHISEYRQLHRLIYLALTLSEILQDYKKEIFGYFAYKLTEKDKSFLASFSEETIRIVEEKVSTARAKAKSATASDELYEETWEEMHLECPVCHAQGYAQGSTAEDWEHDSDGIQKLRLTFYPETFQCSSCGLDLNEFEQLDLAGIETEWERSSEDVEKWMLENYEDPREQYYDDPDYRD